MTASKSAPRKPGDIIKIERGPGTEIRAEIREGDRSRERFVEVRNWHPSRKKEGEWRPGKGIWIPIVDDIPEQVAKAITTLAGESDELKEIAE